MYRENYSKANDGFSGAKLTSIANEKIHKRFTGEIIDNLIDAKTGEIIETRRGHNLIVDSCSKLLASLVKNVNGTGLAYLAYGHGDDSWDDTNLPSPSPDDVKLLDEFYRKAITPDMVKFINNDDAEVEEFSNRIQITITLDANEGNGSLREFGLFGGDSCTSDKDSGLMINRRIHAHIYKTTGMLLERIIRLTF